MSDMRLRPARIPKSRGQLRSRVRGTLICILVLVVLGGVVVWLSKAIRNHVAERIANQHSLGNSLFEDGKYDEAALVFGEMVKTARRSPHVEDALRKLGQIAEQAGNHEKARTYWQRLAEEFADRPSVHEARYHIGLCLENEGGQRSIAEQHYRQVISSSSGGTYAVLATCGVGRLAESDGELEQARDLYQEAFSMAREGTPESKEAVELLGEANVKLIFSGRKTEDSELYTVKPGDTVSSIGEKFNTTQALILRANGIDTPAGLRVNRTLKITPKNFNIVIKKSVFTLTLYDNGTVFKRYQVGLGRPEHPTAPGAYVIESKITNPTWYSPSGKVIPPLSPENELGTRWMGLKPLGPDLPHDLGIHATIDPSSIGWASSRGCPRMHQENAEELFDLVTIGTEVTIVD
jgi:lipoprotein-anchoring transpeptidase ErfK/SrfK